MPTLRRWPRYRSVAAALVLSWRVAAAQQPNAGTPVSAIQARASSFGSEPASADARRVDDWVLTSRDNGTLPFIIVDKVQAKVYVFDSAGQLLGASFALLGKARGDESAPGIGTRRLAAIRDDERTTPAGRFVAFMGRDFEHDLLWIDYSISLSLHRVIHGNPGDHRLQRLATKSALDKRISYGCINVPASFYERIVLKTFSGTKGVVYILPEVKRLQEVFSIGG